MSSYFDDGFVDQEVGSGDRKQSVAFPTQDSSSNPFDDEPAPLPAPVAQNLMDETSGQHQVVDLNSGVSSMSMNHPVHHAISSFASSSARFDKILVGEPELQGGLLSKYHVYKIQTEPPSGPGVPRRYSHFDWLRECLVKSFPGVFVPPLPPKKLLGKGDDTFLAERRSDLEHFLNRIRLSPSFLF